MYLEFPSKLLRPQVMERPVLVASSRSGGRSASNIIYSTRVDGGGLWAWSFNDVPLRTRDQVRVWELLSAYLSFATRPIIVPLCNAAFQPWLVVDGQKLLHHAPVPHSDGSPFSDGTSYVTPTIDAEMASAAELRATTLEVRVKVGSGFRGGELFSINHDELGWRMYRVVQVEDVAGDVSTVRIEPPLREDVTTGKRVEFDRPRCVMQVPADMRVSLGADWRGRPSVSFIESFLPEPV